ncbi:hypothetical protein E4U40_006962 [Claviceps sp. LM458 group G5]|nr:hypothetical protein E4U40_006962 [Claviceps sp. LM458 group G5]
MAMLLQDARLESYAKSHSFPSWSTMSLKSVLTTVVAGSQYLIHPQVVGMIQQTINPDAIIPVTVLETRQLYFQLEGTLALFDFYDDVFNPEFGRILVEKSDANSSSPVRSMQSGAKSVLHLRNDMKTVGASKRSVSDLPAGPYILHGPNLHQAWRIYNDTLNAFAVGVYPDDVDDFDVFNTLQLPDDNASGSALIPVPSKLYHTVPPVNAPLRGFRFTVPDSMPLKGVPTSISSASWNELHNGTADTTAAFAKRLVDLGAVIVGKTKSSQFGSGREWTDTAAPKNPREDGSQDAAGGSTGAGSVVAGYDWLRASTGIDAIGQTLETAAAQGLFALRTSPGRLPFDGLQSSPPISNTMSIFGIDLHQLFRDATAIVHQSLYSPPITFPKRLISVTDLDSAHNGREGRQRHFLRAVEAFLGVQAKQVSLERLWRSKPPVEAKGRSLQNYMRKAPFFSFCYEFYHQYDVFRREYWTAFGRQPAVEPTVAHQWNVGKNVSEGEYEDYQERIAVFRSWFSKNVMPLDEAGDAVLLLPYTTRGPRYTAPEPKTVTGVTTQLLGPLLGAPQVIAPFAQYPYKSNISHQVEYHAIHATLIGANGSDTMLVKLLQATFEQAQWRTKLDKGRFVFPPSRRAKI